MKRILEYPELIIAILALVFVAVLICGTVVHIYLAWKRDGKRKPFRSWHKAWSRKMRMEPTRNTPPNPGDIVSVKPDKDKPWCQNCREHTRYKKTTKWTDSSDGGGRTQVNTYSCRHCKAAMGIPSKLKVAGWALGFVCAGLGWPLHTALAYSPDVFVVERGPFFNLIVFGVPSMIWPAIAFWSCRWSGRITGYHSWLQWAKERTEAI